MAGLFGLFGGNNNDKPKTAYFLDDDAARSEGNREYIRESKTIRRTFPKSANGEEFEIVKSVSSQQQVVEDSRTGMSSFTSTPSSASNGKSAVEPASASAKSEEAQTRRSADTSMDMFRNMAKDMRR
ncbi:MAG: hypothetical protein VKJ24_17050 [Synechococcales bacterium]|nr:hypothetical protein [Synechococcales bacterium]